MDVGKMSDISDDETSPSHHAINAPAALGDAQRALDFFRATHGGASSSRGVFSTNVDMVANPLGRGDAWPPSPDSSGENQGTRSQMREMYPHSSQDEVLDPEMWVLSQ